MYVWEIGRNVKASYSNKYNVAIARYKVTLDKEGTEGCMSGTYNPPQGPCPSSHPDTGDFICIVVCKIHCIISYILHNINVYTPW